MTRLLETHLPRVIGALFGVGAIAAAIDRSIEGRWWLAMFDFAWGVILLGAVVVSGMRR